MFLLDVEGEQCGPPCGCQHQTTPYTIYWTEFSLIAVIVEKQTPQKRKKFERIFFSRMPHDNHQLLNPGLQRSVRSKSSTPLGPLPMLTMRCTRIKNVTEQGNICSFRPKCQRRCSCHVSARRWFVAGESASCSAVRRHRSSASQYAGILHNMWREGEQKYV